MEAWGEATCSFRRSSLPVACPAAGGEEIPTSCSRSSHTGRHMNHRRWCSCRQRRRRRRRRWWWWRVVEHRRRFSGASQPEGLVWSLHRMAQ